jgi:hypothetical protein
MELARAQRQRSADGPSAEVGALRHEVRSLRAQLAQAKTAAKPRPPVVESEQVAKLRERIGELRAYLRHVTGEKFIVINKADLRKIRKCLHPDLDRDRNPPTQDDLQKRRKSSMSLPMGKIRASAGLLDKDASCSSRQQNREIEELDMKNPILTENTQNWRAKEVQARRAIEDHGFVVHDANIIFRQNCPNIDLVVYAQTCAFYVQVKSSKKPAGANSVIIDGLHGRVNNSTPVPRSSTNMTICAANWWSSWTRLKPVKRTFTSRHPKSSKS